MKEIRWLTKPYLKYGKLYFFISVLFAAIILPIDSILQVLFPQAILNLLSSHNEFLHIVLVAIAFESAFLLITLLDDLFNNAYKEALSVRIRTRINREIYEQCCKTRYEYVDNPDYYDKFSWAIREYANKCTEAVGFIISSLTLVITMASLITIIATSIWWVVIIMATSFALKSFVVAKVNKLDIQKDEEMIPVDRKMDYFHRIFFQKSYAAELRTTRLKNIILSHYEEETKNKIHLIRKYVIKTLYLLIINDLLVRIADVLIVIGIAGAIYSGKISEVGAYMTLLLAANKLNDQFYQIFDVFRTVNKLEKYGSKIHEFFSDTVYYCKGDNAFRLERVKESDVIGKVCKIYRAGKHIQIKERDSQFVELSFKIYGLYLRNMFNKDIVKETQIYKDYYNKYLREECL